MEKKLIKKALQESNASSFLPIFASPEKIIDEIKEHMGLLKWSTKRVLIPLAVLYIIMGFIFQEYVLGSLALAAIVFLYTNFLPDLDSFFANKSSIAKKATQLDKIIALCFAPVLIYYTLSKKNPPLNLGSDKAFHNKKALIGLTIFLFIIGIIIYMSLLKAFFLALFGFLGFFTHLTVDGLTFKALSRRLQTKK
ncbi:MAG: hypothetical protein WCW13_05205 [archaeon]|jgi:hypothetical protein